MKKTSKTFLGSALASLLAFSVINALPANAEGCAEGWTLREFSDYCDLIIQADVDVTVPAGVSEVGYLLVGGGGGGGAGWADVTEETPRFYAGGGGGAGGIETGDVEVTAGQTLSVAIGAGGLGGTFEEISANGAGTDGESTVISRSSTPLATALGGGVGQNASESGASGAGGESGNGFAGGSAFDNGTYSAGGGGGGHSGVGVNGALYNGGDGGPGAPVVGTDGLPLSFQTSLTIDRDGDAYQNSHDYIHPFIFLYGLGFGGGGGVTTNFGEGPYCSADGVVGEDAQPSYSPSGNWGNAACAGATGPYSSSANLLESTAFPGQGGNAGVGNDVTSSYLGNGTEGVPGIAWLVYSLSGGLGAATFLDIAEDEILVGESLTLSTDAPLGTPIDIYFNEELWYSFEYAGITSYPYIAFPFLENQCRFGSIIFAIGDGIDSAFDAGLADYAFIEGSADCWGEWEGSIRPQGDFAGAEIDQILEYSAGAPLSEPRSFEVDDWSSSETSDAFDDFGTIEINGAILSPTADQCSLFGDGAEIPNPESRTNLGEFDQMMAICLVSGLVVGAGTVDLRVEVIAQGSMIGWYVYTTGFEGTPDALSVGLSGNLGSDGKSLFESVSSSDNYDWFVSHGDVGYEADGDGRNWDPIIGYRTASDVQVDVTDGEDAVDILTTSSVPVISGDNLILDLEVWMVDFELDFEAEAIQLASSFGAADMPFGSCLSTVSSDSPTLDNQCVGVQSVPYFGPVITNDPQAGSSGSTVTYTGSDLDEVLSATISGQSTAVISKSATSLTLAIPTGLAQGMHDVVLSYSSTEHITLQSGLIVQDSMKVWTQLQPDKTVKMYAKNIVGVGKIQFFHNNTEIAWVRATTALNPKLREASGSHYLVRTRELLEGKNAFEIYHDGVRVWRAAYAG